MNLWLRLLGLFAALVVAALLLKLLPPVVVLVLFVGGVAYVNHILTARVRREHQGARAEAFGLRRERGDPFGLLGYPFALLGRGRDGRVDDVLWGPWQGLDVRVFRFTCAPSGTLGEPGSVQAFVCALAPVEASCPSLALEPQSFLTPPADRPTMAGAETGDATFDGRFHVRCDDAAFVRALLDEPMRSWIEDLGETWGFEVSGRLALVYAPVDGGRQAADALPVLKGFLDRVPAALRSPSPGSTAAAGAPERPDAGAEGG